MRILMMGTGPFAVPTFRGLLDSSHTVQTLVTRPVPPPISRRRLSAPLNPMRELAEASGVVVRTPANINAPDTVAALAEDEADLLVVCDYGQILSSAALETARLGGVNLHGSLLPKYRGAAPVNWALANGETVTGVTVIHMTPRLDAGPCLVQTATRIGPNEDAVELEERLAQMGWPAVRKSLEMLADWDGVSPLGEPQNSSSVSRAPRLRKSDGAIDWTQSAQTVFNHVRAFKPWPGSYCFWRRPKGDLRLLLTHVAVETAHGHLGSPGRVLEAENDRLVVACGEGSLRLLEVQPAGKNRLSCSELLRGYSLQPSDRFHSTAHETR